MRRLVAIGALALLVLAAVPFASAGTTVANRHVDGTVKVSEPAVEGQHGAREWLARFEVRTTPSGAVDFGYMQLYGVSGDVVGAIVEFSVGHVDYYKTATGAQGATLSMEECIIAPPETCFDVDYAVSDGARVGQDDTFIPYPGWEVESGNISIYTVSDQGQQ